MIQILKKNLSEQVAPILGMDAQKILDLLENPKSIDHGQLAFPVFIFAKELKKAPPAIAQELKLKLDGKITQVSSIQATGGYLNFTFSENFLQNLISDSVLNSQQKKHKIGFQNLNGQRVVMDYSSPNVAKPMSIGHLRATVIGQAIRNLAESQGYAVTGINYLGDWGVQFGKLAYAYLEWNKPREYDFKQKPFEALYQLYVDFHKACEEDKELDRKGSLTFKRLEEGDPEIQKIWKLFLEISLKEYDRIYGLLNVKFDLIQGESFYNDKLDPTVEKIKKAGLLQESDGAQVVFMDDDMPPCIIKKSDGASLYATRDIASAMYRHDFLKADHLLYIVGVDQTLHFRQVFSVLQKMNFDWAKNCHHVAFGMYRFKDMGKMSTRRGQVVFMDDVLNKSIELAQNIIEQKNPDLPNKELIAQQVGVGAIIFNDLASDRVKNVDFDWDKVLDFEGDSGPYVQYCIVRCKSILKKYGKDVPEKMEFILNSKEEKNLIKDLLQYPEVLSAAYRNFRPSVLAQYLLEVCKSFNSFYQNHKILDDAIDSELKLSRLRLVQCTEHLLTSGLDILGIQSPEKM